MFGQLVTPLTNSPGQIALKLEYILEILIQGIWLREYMNVNYVCKLIALEWGKVVPT